MTATVLSILAALLPVLLEALDAWQRRDTRYAQKQVLRSQVVNGDTAAVTATLDKLREKAARRRTAGK